MGMDWANRSGSGLLKRMIALGKGLMGKVVRWVYLDLKEISRLEEARGGVCWLLLKLKRFSLSLNYSLKNRFKFEFCLNLN